VFADEATRKLGYQSE